MRIGLLTLILMLALGLPVWGQMHDPVHGTGAGHGQTQEMGDLDRMGEMMQLCLEHADDLDLTDAQVRKLTALHREMQKKHIRFKADRKIAQIDLMEIMEVKDFDFSKATQVVKKLADLKTSHHLDMLNTIKEIRANISNEQFEMMKKMMHGM